MRLKALLRISVCTNRLHISPWLTRWKSRRREILQRTRRMRSCQRKVASMITWYVI